MTTKNKKQALELIEKLKNQINKNMEGRTNGSMRGYIRMWVIGWLELLEHKINDKLERQFMTRYKSYIPLIKDLKKYFYCTRIDEAIKLETSEVLLTAENVKDFNCLVNAVLDMKGILRLRFEELFPKYQIACIHLNGFTHEVFYIDDNGRRRKYTYSAYYVDDAEANESLKVLFSGFYHECYKHNPKEIVYMTPKKFKSFAL